MPVRLLCVGLATVDLIQRVTRLPGADEKVQSDTVEVAAGGPAANAAVTAAALGAEVTLLSAVGDHPLGALIRSDLAAHGVTLIDAAAGSAEPPPVSAVTVLSGTGQRSIVSRNAGDQAFRVPNDDLPDADLTLADGHHPLLAVAAARNARRLLIDAGSWRPVFAELFPLAEVVACSADFRHPEAREAREAPEATGGTDAATATAIGAPHVLVTHGPAPVTWFDRSAGTSGEIVVPPVTAVDTSGAGDAFHGALAVFLAQNHEVRTAAGYAVRTAGVRVRHAGPRAWLAALPRAARPAPGSS
ncbi:PfkB family carbohydrate kinase [Actinoplanes rectilineatus]|uniref:PfkB family carbohydrate kinase n=1 Tax=Actinoplanes rectilineatus TaxID=113571 RepID=UPI0005F2BAAC|nr:PfkB family carbohydrate kinase [Actinoplanes rectilineatus]